MISGLSASNDQFLASLNILQNNLSQANEELSSGLSVNQASDAPQSIQDIFETRAAIGQDTQTMQNLTTIQGQVQAAGSRRPERHPVAQSGGLTWHASRQYYHFQATQQTLATQVQAIEAQLVAISNTEVDGVYVFSGDASGSAPYKVDTSSPTGVDS